MELVTIYNVDHTRKVKLTESGIKFLGQPSYKDTEFSLWYRDYYKENYESNDYLGWWGISSVENIGRENLPQFGVRIGRGGEYDLYYIDATPDIEAIEKDLDQLSYKLEIKFLHNLTK